MATDLRDVAAELLLAPASTLGLELIGSQGKPSTYQSVDLAHGALRVRVQRERATVEVLFGSRAAPFEWFDSSEVIDHFTGTRHTLTSTDPQKSVAMLRDFLASEIGVLTGAFTGEKYESTRAALLRIRRIANEQLAPGRHSRAH